VLVDPLLGLCEALNTTKDLAAARATATRAAELAQRSSPDLRARAELCLVEASWEDGAADRAALLQRARAARDVLATMGFTAREVARVDRWLADRK
jgi:hypothetical protein